MLTAQQRSLPLERLTQTDNNEKEKRVLDRQYKGQHKQARTEKGKPIISKH